MTHEHRGGRVALRQARRRTVLVIVTLVALISLAGCGTDAVRTSVTTRDNAEEVSPLLSTHFALLHAPAEGLPARIEKILEPPVGGMAWDLARRVAVPAPGVYWLVPGASYLCVVAAHPGSPEVGTVCATVGQALRHGVVNTTVDRSTDVRTMVGVVPDGTRRVIVRTGGSDAKARADDGHFVVSDSEMKPPTEVILR